MSEQRVVAVTGASGFVGRHVVRGLLNKGLEVRGLVRDLEKARRVLPDDERLSLVVGDALDGESPENLVRGADAAVHLIGIIREAPGGQTFQRMHVSATLRVVRAAEQAGVRRYLHMSALGTRADAPSEYWRSKFEAEQVVRSSNLDWTVFRPSTIHGVGSGFMQQALGWATGRTVPFVFLPYFKRAVKGGRGDRLPLPRFEDPVLQPVWVEDVAAAFVGALQRQEAIGEVYNIVGSETLSWPEMLVFIRDHVPNGKRNLRPVGIPGGLAAVQARVAGALGLGQLLPFDAGMAIMGQSDIVATLDKARAHLGFEPRGFRETMAAYAPQM